MTPEEKMEFVIGLGRKALENGELPIAAAIYNGDELVPQPIQLKLQIDGSWFMLSKRH